MRTPTPTIETYQALAGDIFEKAGLIVSAEDLFRIANALPLGDERRGVTPLGMPWRSRMRP